MARRSGTSVTIYTVTFRFTSATTFNIVDGGAVALASGGVAGFGAGNEIIIDRIVGIK